MGKKRRLLTGLGRAVIGVFYPDIAKILNNPIGYLNNIIYSSYEKNPELTVKLVTAAYPFVDTIVENYAKRTKTQKDDQYVSDALRLLEEFAKNKGFELDNLDED